MQYLSTCHRKEEAVEMLKLFYDGVNPNAPNPKVKGVRVNKTTSDAMHSKRWWQPAIWRIKWKNVHIFLYNKWAWYNGWCKNRTIWPFLDKSFPTKSKSSVKVIFLNTTSSWSEFSMFSRNTHLDNGRHSPHSHSRHQKDLIIVIRVNSSGFVVRLWLVIYI